MRNPTGCDVVLRWFRQHQKERLAVFRKAEKEAKEIRVGPGGKFPVVFADACPDCPYRK